MANLSNYASFDLDALKGMLNKLGLPFPKKDSREDLEGLLNGAENALGADLFREQVAGAAITTSVSSTTSVPSTKSITPGSSVLYTLLSGIGGLTSQTWDPPTPLEYGRTLI